MNLFSRDMNKRHSILSALVRDCCLLEKLVTRVDEVKIECDGCCTSKPNTNTNAELRGCMGIVEAAFKMARYDKVTTWLEYGLGVDCKEWNGKGPMVGTQSSERVGGEQI